MIYLDVAGYIERYGAQEATRLTSEVAAPGTPAIDDVKIEAAINDSEEEIDGYVGRRYTLPLASTPRILQTWVATLAREKLHKTRPTPEVTAAADRTRSQLRETSTGVFRLFNEDDSIPTANVDREAATSNDADDPIFTRTDMDDYTSLGRSGYMPVWRQ